MFGAVDLLSGVYTQPSIIESRFISISVVQLVDWQWRQLCNISEHGCPELANLTASLDLYITKTHRSLQSISFCNC